MKWFLPLLIITCVLLLGSFIFGIFALVRTAFVTSYPYKVALARFNASAEVAARIGTPVHVGWLITGAINTNGPSGDASLNIPFSGPKGKGEIVVIAKERANHWEFETLEVYIEGQSQPIELTAPEIKPPLSSPEKAI
jgi:hypothetical protein